MVDNRFTPGVKNYSQLKFKVMAKTDYKTADEYLKVQNKEVVTALQALRSSIKKVFPDLKEYISYQIPTFQYKGKSLVSYAAYKNHCGFYINSMKTANKLKTELKNVEINGVTIQFGFEETLPQTLLKKIIKARMQEINELIILKNKKR